MFKTKIYKHNNIIRKEQFSISASYSLLHRIKTYILQIGRSNYKGKI